MSAAKVKADVWNLAPRSAYDPISDISQCNCARVLKRKVAPPILLDVHKCPFYHMQIPVVSERFHLNPRLRPSGI